MVFGGVEEERIALSEDTLWSWLPAPEGRGQAWGFQEIRRQVEAEAAPAAEALAEAAFLGIIPPAICPWATCTLPRDTGENYVRALI